MFCLVVECTANIWVAPKVLQSAINLKIAILIKFCTADERHALPVHHTNPYRNYNFQNDCTSQYFGL